MPTIPFTVLGGFLGAGKTTLLNRWLAEAASQDGLRIAVLVNDFGAINIDAGLVAQAGGDAIALSNGCVCCAIGDDLSAALDGVLRAQPPFDAVVVEASGVSDPWRIAQHALADPRRLHLQAVLLLVDAAALAGHLADPLLTDTLTRPLAHADLVVLNHADRASAAQRAAARAWVLADARQRGQPAPPVTETTQADLPLALLADRLHTPRGGGLATRPADHGAQFQAWQAGPDALPAAACFDDLRLRAWLRALPPGVLRLKGWLPVAGGGWLALQWAGRHASLRRLAGPPPPAAALVAIGLAGQLPVQALADGLRTCLADNPAPTLDGLTR